MFEISSGDAARAREAVFKLESEAHMLFRAMQGGSMPEPSSENSS
jgi:hypothetical protein